MLRVTRLNDVPAGYNVIMALQDAIFQQRKLNLVEDTMLLLQVSPCINFILNPASILEI